MAILKLLASGAAMSVENTRLYSDLQEREARITTLKDQLYRENLALRDEVLTRDELAGLMQEMLTSRQEPNCGTRFSDWIEANAETIGGHYTSEMARHFRWKRGDAS